MQKKMIVLALAAISAAPAFAQSNVTVYGRVDYGFLNRSGNSGAVQGVDSKHEFASGIQAGSRLGFRGTEDLGNGLKAIFEVEQGLSNDVSNGRTAGVAGGAGAFSTLNRHSYVGLTGNFGTFVGGRLDGVRYGIFNKYDAFAGGGAGNFTQTTIQVDRADNAIAYISPRFSGFQVTAAYATSALAQEAAGNTGDSRLNTIMGNYENGPISVTADYETVKQVDGQGKHRVTTIAGSYDFGVVKVAALWDKHRSDFGTANDNIDYRDYFLSATVPFAGKFTGKITWGKVDNKLAGFDSNDSTKWGLGLNYALSKRTGLFVDYGKIRNKSNAALAINVAANSNGAGYGVKAFDLGIAHTF